MKFRIKMAIAAIILFFSAYFIDFQPEHTKFKDWPVELVQVYSGTSTGKYSHLEFIAVYRLDDGRLIDRKISASTYSQAKIGQRYTINARGMDLFQEDRMAGPIFIGVGYMLFKCLLWLSAAICTLLLCLPQRFIDWCNED